MVHLRSVRMRGFKSLLPTELVFEPGVTVIIGPNGSGKSNIADAVLWFSVSRAGNLRGRTMRTSSSQGLGRKSSAVAEVSLVLTTGAVPCWRGAVASMEGAPMRRWRKWLAAPRL